MTTSKTFLCRCEDLTVDDCTEAIADGYTCFEDLKRFLGVGTGPCQGKSCVQAAMHLIAQTQGIPVTEVDVMTFRPPVRPIPFETLAAADSGDPAAEVGGDADARDDGDADARDGGDAAAGDRGDAEDRARGAEGRA